MSLLKVHPSAPAEKSGKATQDERLQRDQQIEIQHKQVQSNMKTNLVAQWAESLDEMCENKILKRKNEDIRREILLGNTCLHKVRKHQLKELLEKEQAQYEQELHDMGLAIHKERL